MSSVTDRTLPLSAIATRRFGKLQWTAARAGLIGAVVFALLPLFAGEYWLNAVLIPFLAMSLAGIGLNLLMGYTGQASLGTGAFMAVGTYATYNFLLRVPALPLPISLVLGGLVAACAGVIFGLPSLRIKGFYLLATTLAAQFFLEWMFNQYGWFSNYSTSNSISAPHLVFLGRDLSGPVGRYYLTLATVALLTIAAVNIVRSQTGRNWMAIRDMDTAAAVIGIPVAANKLLAFAVSSFYCGIAGALWAFAYLGTVDARSFNLDRSFQVMFVIIIGGMGSIAGNFVGAAFILLLPILIDHLAGSAFGNLIEAGQLENLQKVLFGSLIIYLLIKEPAGLTALFGTLRRKLGFPPRRADEPAHSSNQPTNERNDHVLSIVASAERCCGGGTQHCCIAAPTVLSAGSPNEQFIPLATFRVGAYASSGIPLWGGIIDTFRYINEVQGGINGVKLFWEECETEWQVEKGIECYERFRGGKDGSPVPIYLPNGDPIAKALLQRATADKLAIPTLNYGPTEAIDGRIFPYAFPLMLSFYSEASTAINYIAQVEGGKDKLKGLKIATLYHDSPYGKETQAALALLAKHYGFEDIQIPVPHPGNDQTAQWARIRQLKPDWVFVRGWGVMTPVAIKTAAKTGFPVDHVIGGIWSSSEEDVIPAGAVGKGYLAITTYPAGTNFPIHAALKKYILDAGKSDLKDPKSFGSVYYNSGIVHAIFLTEAIRTAQAKFGNRPINGAEGQWGLEHLKIDEKRLEEIGVSGLMQPLKLSCLDHEGGGSAKVIQWDGTKWNIVSDWIRSDRELLRPLIDEKAAAYAKEKGIAPRDCSVSG